VKARIIMGVLAGPLGLSHAGDFATVTDLPYPAEYSVPHVKGNMISPPVPIRFTTRAIGSGVRAETVVSQANVLRGGPGGLLGAVAAGDLPAVKQLVAEGADVRATDVHGVTPLLVASAQGAAEIVKLLLERDAEVNAADRSGRTPLMAAAANGHAAVVALLLQQKADVTVRDARGWTARDYAAVSQHKETVALLRTPPVAPAGKQP
jgi:hypothetical protein